MLGVRNTKGGEDVATEIRNRVPGAKVSRHCTALGGVQLFYFCAPLAGTPRFLLSTTQSVVTNEGTEGT